MEFGNPMSLYRDLQAVPSDELREELEQLLNLGYTLLVSGLAADFYKKTGTVTIQVMTGDKLLCSFLTRSKGKLSSVNELLYQIMNDQLSEYGVFLQISKP
jgi:hypothetical protein